MSDSPATSHRDTDTEPAPDRTPGGQRLPLRVWAELRSQRSTSTWVGYLIALLVSAGLAILLRLVAPNPAAPIFWFALTAFGVFWAWYWERTEPLPKA